MGLVRVTDCRFMNDSAQAERSAREQMRFITANAKKLLRLRGGTRSYTDAMELAKVVTEFTPGQRSYIEKLYEKVWKAANYDAVNTHHDKKKKGCGL